MSKANLIAIGICAGVLGIAGSAPAQTSGPEGLSVRLGVFFPNAGDNVLAAGLSYKFQSVVADAPTAGTDSYVGLSLDYYGDNDAYNLPLALTYNVRNQQLVLSAGIGVDIYDGSDDTKVGLGGQVGVQYDFARRVGAEGVNPIFLAAKYFLANDNDRSGFAVYLGYRF